MVRPVLPLMIAAASFLVAAYCLVQINRLDRLTDPQDQRAAIGAALQEQGVSLLPMADPPGTIIDAAVRFRSAGCSEDSFVLPVTQGISAEAYTVRFTELSGVTYRPIPFHIDGNLARKGPVFSQIARNMRQLGMVFGLGRVQNANLVLTVFQPEDCTTALMPDFTAFWVPREQA